MLVGCCFYYYLIRVERCDVIKHGGRCNQFTTLIVAHLEGANLENADLLEANLVAAHLQGAKLIRTRFQDAELGNADLRGANLEEANLAGARLDGAHLTEVKGLTQDQVNIACVDEETKLPEGFTKPAPCPEAPPSQ
jgi:uncharacterized protein YjbI with pentapeptide repeats